MNLPTELKRLFSARKFSIDDIREVSPGVFRVKSAYGPGDFRVLSNGLVENSWAGFIGREDKVCYVEHLDPKQDYKVVYEEMI